MSKGHSKYRFSFTAGALLHEEMVLVANELIRKDFEFDRLSADVLGKTRDRTGKREFVEVILRLKTLDRTEIEYLGEGTSRLSRQIALLACIRAYGFIKDFFLDVILNKVALFDFSLTERDYISFVRNKELMHPELEGLADSTKYKVKQVLFKILLQAGFIESLKAKQITLNYIEPKLSSWLKETGKLSELKLLLG